MNPPGVNESARTFGERVEAAVLLLIGATLLAWNRSAINLAAACAAHQPTVS
jgi:hypothetical protein